MYLKLSAGEGRSTVIPLTDENVFSICPVCGEEHQIDIEDLAKNKLLTASWFEDSPRVCCWPCTVQIKKEGLDAVMEQRKESLAYELKQQSGE